MIRSFRTLFLSVHYQCISSQVQIAVGNESFVNPTPRIAIILAIFPEAVQQWHELYSKVVPAVLSPEHPQSKISGGDGQLCETRNSTQIFLVERILCCSSKIVG